MHSDIVSQASPLDSSAFPHILDDIIRIASDDVLLALRLTSRGMCERVDRRLFSHIAVDREQNPFGQPVSLSSPYGRLPRQPHTSRLPQHALVHVRSLSMRNPLPFSGVGRPAQRLKELCDAIPNLQVIQYLPPLISRHFVSLAQSTETMVVTTRLVVPFRERFSEPRPPLFAGVPYVPEWVKLLAINVLVNVKDSWDHGAVLWDLESYNPQNVTDSLAGAAALRHALVIFSFVDDTPEFATQFKMRTAAGFMYRPYPPRTEPAGVLDRLIPTMANSLPRVAYTLIGLQELVQHDRRALGPARKAKPEDVAAIVLASLKAELRVLERSEAEIERAVEAVSFFSRGEYCARVGIQAFRLYTPE